MLKIGDGESIPREQKKQLVLTTFELQDKCRLLMTIAAHGQERKFFERHGDWKGYSAARGMTDASRAQSNLSVHLLKLFYAEETDFPDTKSLFIGNPVLKSAGKDWFERIRFNPDEDYSEELGEQFKHVIESIVLSRTGMSELVAELKPENDGEYLNSAGVVMKLWRTVKADFNKWMNNFVKSGQNSPEDEICFVLGYNDLPSTKVKIDKELQVFVALLSKIKPEFKEFNGVKPNRRRVQRLGDCAFEIRTFFKPRSRTRLPLLASPTPRCRHLAPTVRNLSQGRLSSTGVDLHYFFFLLVGY